MSIQRKERLGKYWLSQFIGKNVYRVWYDNAGVNYIITSTSDVTTELAIPWSHRWISIHFKHYNSAGNDLYDYPLKVIIRRPPAKNTPYAFSEDVFYGENMMFPTISETFGEKFEREPSVYNVVLNAHDTDRIAPVFYIQKLDGGTY